MSISIFGDLDVASANENPFFKPDGTYVCKLTTAEIRFSKAGNKIMPLEYTIQEGPKMGKKIQEWKPVPEVWNVHGYETEEDWKTETNYSDKIKENAERNLAFIKQRMKQFGFSQDEMNSVQPSDLLQLPLLNVEIKNEGGQERIKGITLYDGDAGDGNPFA